jgi:gamma-glutamylputrescine oxidase
MLVKEVYWYTQKRPRPHVLMHDQYSDVVIVGGGMAGLMTAQKLREAGASVVVLEKEFCGSGASGKSSGFITPNSELELSDFIARYGVSGAGQIWEFAIDGVEKIRSNILDLEIECDYQPEDSLFVASTKKGLNRVAVEHRARIQAGYSSVFYDRSNIREVIGTRDYFGAVRYGGTFGINSYVYCQQLKKRLEQSGVKIFEQTPVSNIDFKGGFLNANGFQVRASKIVLCTDHWMPKFNRLQSDIHHKQTFLALSRPLRDFQVEQIFPEGKMMVWDSDSIYYYYRITGDNRLLVGGSNILYTYTRSAKFGVNHILRNITKYISQKFPKVAVDFEYVWPGLMGVSKDLAPIAGRDIKNPDIYFIGAAAGLPWAASLGGYIADKIIDGRNELDSVFSPQRKMPVSNYLQKIISKPLSFAISHGISKYF